MKFAILKALLIILTGSAVGCTQVVEKPVLVYPDLEIFDWRPLPIVTAQEMQCPTKEFAACLKQDAYERLFDRYSRVHEAAMKYETQAKTINAARWDTENHPANGH